jgi:hypothetical protein
MRRLPKVAELIANKPASTCRAAGSRGVEAFYRDCNFAPLWVGNNAPLPRAGTRPIPARVAADGLQPADYPTPNSTGRKRLRPTNSSLRTRS